MSASDQTLLLAASGAVVLDALPATLTDAGAAAFGTYPAGEELDPVSAVLPLGTSQETHEPPTDGSQWGAPKTPNLKKKFLTTTWVSAIVWAFVMVLIFTGWLPLPDFSSAPAV